MSIRYWTDIESDLITCLAFYQGTLTNMNVDLHHIQQVASKNTNVDQHSLSHSWVERSSPHGLRLKTIPSKH